MRKEAMSFSDAEVQVFYGDLITRNAALAGSVLEDIGKEDARALTVEARCRADDVRIAVTAFYCEGCKELHYEYQMEQDKEPRRFAYHSNGQG